MELMNILPPLGAHKNPAIAFIIGYFTGGIGLVFYFWSLPDFFLCVIFGFIVFASLPLDLFSGGLATLILCAIPGIYGYIRASNSNKRLGA